MERFVQRHGLEYGSESDGSRLQRRFGRVPERGFCARIKNTFLANEKTDKKRRAEKALLFLSRKDMTTENRVWNFCEKMKKIV